MEDNFRNILIIISAIIIAAIFIHGVWTIRKEKNPYKLKASKEKTKPLSRDFDGKGFDQDGVGQVKVTKLSELESGENETEFAPTEAEKDSQPSAELVGQTNLAASQHLTIDDIKVEESAFERQSETEADPLDDTYNKEHIESDTLQESALSEKTESTIAPLSDEIDDWFGGENSGTFSKDELGDTLVSTQSDIASEQTQVEQAQAEVKREPLYQEPVTQAKPTITTAKKTKKSASKKKAAVNQIEIDFDNQLANNDELTSQGEEVIQEKANVEPQVIILSVVMPENQQMLGAVLLPTLLTLGLKYGEMNIFHRHEDNAGNGKVTFSLANMLNPGAFDLDSMENFATRGVSLFMTLPNAGNSSTVFEHMLNAAKQLAQEFGAQVIDENRNVMTKQTEQHYISKIREFDRKSRIVLVE